MKIHLFYSKALLILCFLGVLFSCNNSPRKIISNGDKVIEKAEKEPAKQYKIGDQDFPNDKVPPTGLYKYISSVNEAMNDISNEYAPEIKYINVKIDDGIVSFQTGKIKNGLVDNPVDWASKDGDISLKNMFCNNFKYNGNDTIVAMQGGASFGYYDYFIRENASNNDKTIQSQNQLSIKTILDLNLRDIATMKDILGKPTQDEGDRIVWELKDYIVEYRAAYPALIVSFNMSYDTFYSDLNQYLSFSWKGKFYKEKVVLDFKDHIELAYRNEYEQRSKSRYVPPIKYSY